MWTHYPFVEGDAQNNDKIEWVPVHVGDESALLLGAERVAPRTHALADVQQSRREYVLPMDIFNTMLKKYDSLIIYMRHDTNQSSI